MTKNPFGFIRYPGSSHLFISGCWTGYVTALDYGLSWWLADFDRYPTKRLSVLFCVKLELGIFVLTCWSDCLSRSSLKSISLLKFPVGRSFVFHTGMTCALSSLCKWHAEL